MTPDSATALLKIARPEDLFVGELDEAKRLYRQLSRRWHPDVSGGDARVFSHLSDLYRKAIDKLGRGIWEGAATITLRDARDREIVLPVRASQPFELGQSLVGDDYAAWILNPEHAAFVAAGDWTRRYRFASDAMRAECARYVPAEWKVEGLSDGRWLVRVRKTPDLIRLRDLVTHMGGLDPRHVAWVVSSLLNLACYLSYTDIAHQDISPDTYFVSPEFHSGALLGGWWYARERGSRIAAVPKRTYDLMPFRMRATKQASALTDLELVRATGRECLRTAAPEPMRSWLRSVGSGSALEQYRHWQAILQASFGARKYIELTVDADAVYAARTGR